jgi:hypothetical protein
MDSEAKVNPYIQRNPFNFTILPNSFAVMLKYADKDRAGNINMGFPAHFLISRKASSRCGQQDGTRQRISTHRFPGC